MDPSLEGDGAYYADAKLTNVENVFLCSPHTLSLFLLDCPNPLPPPADQPKAKHLHLKLNFFLHFIIPKCVLSNLYLVKSLYLEL